MVWVKWGASEQKKVNLPAIEKLVIQELKALTDLSLWQLSGAIVSLCYSLKDNHPTNRAEWIKFGGSFSQYVQGYNSNYVLENEYQPWLQPTKSKQTIRSFMPPKKPISGLKLKKNELPVTPDVLDKPSRRPAAHLSIRFIPVMFKQTINKDANYRSGVLVLIFDRMSHYLSAVYQEHDELKLSSMSDYINVSDSWIRSKYLGSLFKLVEEVLSDFSLPIKSIQLPAKIREDSKRENAISEYIFPYHYYSEGRISDDDRKAFKTFDNLLKKYCTNVYYDLCPMLRTSTLWMRHPKDSANFAGRLANLVELFNEHTLTKHHESPDDRLARVEGYWPEKKFSI